jgi:hypothetical protein
MKTFILSIFAFSLAHACATTTPPPPRKIASQYTCDDRQALEDALHDLRESCGGDNSFGGTVCTAQGYSGSSVDSAIASCQKNISFSYASNCLSGVTCTGRSSVCTAQGYSGSNVESAIASCQKNISFAYASNCLSGVKCTGRATVCSAQGYSGSSVERAIASCQKNISFAYASNCQSGVTCN